MIFGDVLSGIVDNCSMSVLQSRLKYSNNIQKTISLPEKKKQKEKYCLSVENTSKQIAPQNPTVSSLEFQIVYPTLAGRPTYNPP